MRHRTKLKPDITDMVLRVTPSPKGKDLLLHENRVFKEQRKNADGSTIRFRYLAFKLEPTSDISSVFFLFKIGPTEISSVRRSPVVNFRYNFSDEVSRSTFFIF